MATAAAKATRRAVIAHAQRTAQGSSLALAVSTQIGGEWRAFCHLSFLGRVRWLLTGRIRAPRAQAPADLAATVTKPETDPGAAA